MSNAGEDVSKPPVLEMRNVGYEIDDKRILRSITWTIQPGEQWALIGPSGAGKTTLLRIAGGYLWPNAGGTVRRRGKERQDLSQLWKQVGWVSSEFLSKVPDRQTVLDTVVTGQYAQSRLAPPKSADLASDRSRASEHLATLECEDLGTLRFGVLSQGEKQLVLIARALMTSPYVILLDEPCAGMDPGSRERFLSSLETFVRDHPDTSCVYVTHHLEEIMPVFSRVLLLAQGTVVRRGVTQDVLDPDVIRELYGIDLELVRKNGRFWPLPP